MSSPENLLLHVALSHPNPTQPNPPTGRHARPKSHEGGESWGGRFVPIEAAVSAQEIPVNMSHRGSGVGVGDNNPAGAPHPPALPGWVLPTLSPLGRCLRRAIPCQHPRPVVKEGPCWGRGTLSLPSLCTYRADHAL